jgi:hypothetical protein
MESFMKKMFLILLVSTIVLSTVACSEEKSLSKSSATSVNKDPDLTGKRFFDSAATKVMNNNSGLTRKNANCVVQNITGDGQIGLGEVNQMHLTKGTMSQNTERLNKAYSAAIQACQ